MPSAKQLLFKAEDLLGDTLSVAHYRYAAMAANYWLKDKAQLRGRQCHCPAGMPRHLLHSEGLREAADVVIDFGSNVHPRERRQVPVALLRRVANQIGTGDIVHVKADLMGPFVEHVFNEISGPIILITGDSDFPPVGMFRHLLDDVRLLHWFAQNCDIPDRHPKLTRIPIGIDNPIYTKLEKRIGFFIEMALGKSPFDLTASRNEIGNQRLLQVIAKKTRREKRGQAVARPLYLPHEPEARAKL